MTALRDVPTHRLQVELIRRRRCAACGTEVSSGWAKLPRNRIRCTDCDKEIRAKASLEAA